MKNLEIKVELTNNEFSVISILLRDYFIEDLQQKDTYYQTTQGRLKLREETNKTAYFIYYERPDIHADRYSSYEFFEIKNINTFHNVFKYALIKELIVEKCRSLYLIKNARIHLDKVNNLGYFLEIEIVISTDKEMNDSKNFMQQLLNQLDIQNKEKIDCGYRELTIQYNSQTKDINYYIKEQKIYWVVNQDINENIKANNVIPCIFIEVQNDKKLMLQLDLDIKFDNHKYTAFRKVIGKIYNIKVDVLLIHDNKLYTLNNNVINFNDIGRSNIYVDKKYLSPIDIKGEHSFTS